jgi:SAM-dependent methyltransferase
VPYLVGVTEINPTAAGSAITDAESRVASRGWWDSDADVYQAEHGAFLGDLDFVWCPEGLREADARLLGDVRGRRVLELGAGAAAGARWLAGQGAEVTALDLSAGMLRHARAAAARTGVGVPLVQADALALPFADGVFDIVCTAFGAIPFVADSGAAMREVARVLRTGGSWVFSITHPMRWIFWDEPDESGLIARNSYFDRSPYVETRRARRAVLRRAAPHARRPGARTGGGRLRAARPGRAGVAGGARAGLGSVEPAARPALPGYGDLRIRSARLTVSAGRAGVPRSHGR